MAQVPPTASTNPIKREQSEGYPVFDNQAKITSHERGAYPEYIGPQLKSPDVMIEPEKSVARPMGRTTATTLSSSIFFIIGIIGLCIGVFLLLFSGSLMAGAVSLSFFKALPYVSAIIKGDVISLSLEFLLILLSGFHFVAGNWLWQSLRRGGILGFTIIGFNFLICVLVIFFFPVIATFAYVVIVVNALLLLTVLLGWNTLHPTIPSPPA